MIRRAALAALLLVGTAGPPAAQDPAAAASLQASADRIAAAEAALQAAANPGAAAAALAAAMRAYEAALAELRGAVIGASAEERALTLDLQVRRAEIERLVVALQTIGAEPRPAQALHPGGPLAAARAASTLAEMTPRLQAEAQKLADQLAEIETARALRERGVTDLTEGLARLAAARQSLLAALDAGRPPPGPDEAAVSAALVRDADTLTVLADKVAALGAGPDAPPAPEDDAPPRLGWPVQGAVLRGFREPDAAGVRRPGMLVEAAPLSLVVSPADAVVRYAGPFLDYGYVTVLEPRTDTLIVLAGLATIETRTGAVVRAGDVLGLLGGRQLDAQEYLMLSDDGSGETPGETLYIEVRHGQGPVDPAPWFEERNG